MNEISKNEKKIQENMIKLVDTLYYFCHTNFLPEPGEERGRLNKYPFFPALITAIGALMLDESYDPPIFEANEEVKNKFFWLYKNCDWIVKNPQTPFFYRCLSYKPPKKVKSLSPFELDGGEDDKLTKVIATSPFSSELKPQASEEQTWEQLLALVMEKVESEKRRKQCLNQQP